MDKLAQQYIELFNAALNAPAVKQAAAAAQAADIAAKGFSPAAKKMGWGLAGLLGLGGLGAAGYALAKRKPADTSNDGALTFGAGAVTGMVLPGLINKLKSSGAAGLLPLFQESLSPYGIDLSAGMGGATPQYGYAPNYGYAPDSYDYNQGVGL